MIVFGPVPSRRLGYSLGINHIPPKNCTYSCVYCQVGRTTSLGIERREFFPVSQIIQEVGASLQRAEIQGRKIDFLTLVPDGEPTLDINLHQILSGLKDYNIPLAVISNSSFINLPEVQEALVLADWVSLKIDSVEEMVWREIDRPHHQLSLEKILEGIHEFRRSYSGFLVTETMLVSGINDTDHTLNLLFNFLESLAPNKSYFSIPLRPPAEKQVKLPDVKILEKLLYKAIQDYPFFDFLFDMEIGDFSSTGDLAGDILGITAVHPMREESLREMVSSTNGDWDVVESLLDSNQLDSVSYLGERFFLNNIGMKSSNKKVLIDH